MTNEEILAMAKECHINMPSEVYADEVSFKQLKRFAELVRNQVLSAEPVAIRYEFDGHGWMYYDNGNTSNWLEIGMKKLDAEPLYVRSTT